MQITSGDRVIEGTIQERQKATRIYEAARKQGLLAALLAQERPNRFTQARTSSPTPPSMSRCTTSSA
jgi:hypothetical protein